MRGRLGITGALAWALVVGGVAGGCDLVGKPTGGIHARMAWSEEGMRVVDVPPDGPAAAAGLEEGDRVVTIDDEPVSTLAMSEAVERLRGRVGSKVKLEVLRDEEVHEVVIPRARYEGR